MPLVSKTLSLQDTFSAYADDVSNAPVEADLLVSFLSKEPKRAITSWKNSLKSRVARSSILWFESG